MVVPHLASLLGGPHKFHRSLDRLQDVIRLILYAALFSTAISATIGVGSLWLGNLISFSQVKFTWLAWWTGDVMGDLAVAPLLLVLSNVTPKCALLDKSKFLCSKTLIH